MVSAFSISYTAAYGRIAGYQVKVVDDAMQWISAYPINVFNESDQFLGLVENPDELLRLWNADAENQRVGRLELDVQSTIFWLIPTGLVAPRGFVKGALFVLGEFSDAFDNSFKN